MGDEEQHCFLRRWGRGQGVLMAELQVRCLSGRVGAPG